MDERQEFLEQWANAVVRAAEAIKSGNIEVGMQIQQEAEEAYWNYKQTEEDTIEDAPSNDLAMESRNMEALIDESIRRTINEFGEKYAEDYGKMARKDLEKKGNADLYHKMYTSMTRNNKNGKDVYKKFQKGFETPIEDGVEDLNSQPANNLATESKKNNKIKVTESQLFKLVDRATNLAIKEIKTKNKNQ